MHDHFVLSWIGKVEKVPDRKSLHLTHSENILDLLPADPHVTNTREALPARMAYQRPPMERYNTTSVMKKDYGPMRTRS